MSWRDKTYTCENLTYNLPGLIKAIALLLIGFFVYTLCTSFVAAIMPLKLDELGANSKVIVLIMSTIGQIFNITICPMVSFQSDRYRSKRWGRRIPFILFSLPMMVTAWVLFAFVDSEATAICKLIVHWIDIAPATMTVVLIGIIMALYQFFLMYVGSVIYYIYNDTIPAQFLARVVGLIQVTCACGGMVFSFFIFEHGLTHFRAMLLLTAAIYTVGMGVFCLLTKEPRFPEPPPLTKEKSGFKTRIAGLTAFFKESFSHPFYLYNFLGTGCHATVYTVTVFLAFMHINMGLELSDIGNMGGIIGFTGMVISFTVALFGSILVDRYHPVRFYTVIMLYVAMIPVLGSQWLLFSPGGSNYWLMFLAAAVMVQPLTQFMNISSMPMLMRIFPKSRFGQFCAAQSMLRSGMVLVAGLVYGALIDFLKFNCNFGNYAYRFGLLWQVFWAALAALFYALAYREFIKLGGIKGYRAPAKWSPDGFEEMAITPVVGSNYNLTCLSLKLLDLGMLIPTLSSLGFYVYSKESSLLKWSLPAGIALLAIWGFVRLGIMRDMRLTRSGKMPKNGLPHHGLLFIGAGLQIVFALFGSWQIFQVLRTEAPVVPGQMLAYNCAVGAVFAVILWCYCRLEKNNSTSFDS